MTYSPFSCGRLLIALAITIMAIPFASALEQPDYSVVASTDDVEIRVYEPHLVARSRVTGQFERAGNVGFRVLANFIFGGNQEQQEIAMTAPVSQTPAGDNDYFITFMMPKEFTRQSLPTPNNTQIEVIEMPQHTVAAIRYRGGWSENRYLNHESRLLGFLEDNETWQQNGEPIWARYNPPIVPSFFRKNEILVPVIRRR
jgi:effector-binding domain-containing protein